jgi:hypothetical protein
MLLRPLFILSLVFIVREASFSQDSSGVVWNPQYTFSLSTGISSHAVRDEMISPLLYRGTQAPLAFSFRYRGIENRHAVLFYYDNTELNSSITRSFSDVAESHYIKNLNLNFEYSIAHNVATFEDLHTTGFLGVRLSSIFNMRNHYVLQDKNHMSAEQMTGLGIHVLTETTLERESNNYLRVEINIPCISYVLLGDRYNANVSQKFDDVDFEQSLLWQLVKKGDFVTFDRLFEVQADVSYIYFVSNHIGFDLQYRLLYYSFAQYQDLFRARVLNNQFLLGVTAKL